MGRGVLANVCLRNNDLRHGDASKLAVNLTGNANLLKLDLRSNKLGDLGARHLAAAIASGWMVESLDLQGNKIEDQGLEVLSDAICSAGGSKLGSLNIKDNPACTAGDGREAKNLLAFVAKQAQLAEAESRLTEIFADAARAPAPETAQQSNTPKQPDKSRSEIPAASSCGDRPEPSEPGTADRGVETNLLPELRAESVLVVGIAIGFASALILQHAMRP